MSGADVAIATYLLGTKVAGQANVVAVRSWVDESVPMALRDASERLRRAESVSLALHIEAEAASLYWSALAPVAITFVKNDLPRVPEHWRTFAQRGSPLTNSPRRAVNPANATLNYLYALLEAQTILALSAAGLDPGMGCFHVDVPGRASFALDVMEAVRPVVDAIALDLFASRLFTFRDAVEMRDGSCRIAPALAVTLARLTPKLYGAVAPIVEHVVALLLAAPAVTSSQRVFGLAPTHLTQTRRRVARPATVRRSNAEPLEPRRCRDCGARLLASHRQRLCPACSERSRPAMIDGFVSAGLSALARRRLAGDDPAHGGAAAKARGDANAEHQRAARAFVDDGSLDAIDFARDIMPRLQGMSLREIAEACGLSQAFCSRIRAGHVVPHRRHWLALKDFSE